MKYEITLILYKPSGPVYVVETIARTEYEAREKERKVLDGMEEKLAGTKFDVFIKPTEL